MDAVQLPQPRVILVNPFEPPSGCLFLLTDGPEKLREGSYLFKNPVQCFSREGHEKWSVGFWRKSCHLDAQETLIHSAFFAPKRFGPAHHFARPREILNRATTLRELNRFRRVCPSCPPALSSKARCLKGVPPGHPILYPSIRDSCGSTP
jgi:hypothetical protein